MASERDREIWDDATNAVCQAMQEQKMCNCPDGDCLAAKIDFSPEKIATATRPAPAAPDTGLVTEPMRIEVCKGSTGLALYVNDGRICGPRHNGRMETILSGTVDAVTRSQAEELLAAKEAERAEQWRLRREMEADRDTQKAIATSLETELAAERAEKEKERLRFEGDLDKWMKIIGAGITGYQPEAYALMDLACQELVTLRADNAALIHDLNRIKDHETELVNGNAAKDARIKELEEYAREATKAITGLTSGGSEYFGKEIGDVFTADLPYCLERIRERYVSKVELKRVEAKLAAAKQFIQFCVDGFFVTDDELRGAARAALGGKPS